MSLGELPSLPPRPADAHKGMFGHALLLGGFQGMTGAILIAGKSCLRSGAGLTTLAVPEAASIPITMTMPCAMTLGLAEQSKAPALLERLQTGRLKAAILAIGPGLGRSQSTDELAHLCWNHWPNTAIFDADALNALSDHSVPSLVDHLSKNRTVDSPARILTPHPGEWERISGVSAKDRVGQIAGAQELAKAWRSVIVLKGAKTIITDGERIHYNTTGNPSLAVGGSGDALTGIITALVCQSLSPFDAAVLGVHLHGLAGDLAHAALGTPSTLATDLINHLPAAFQSISQS